MESEETFFQLFLSATHRVIALRGCHDKVGHLGLEQMLDFMWDQFYWPHMAAQVKEHIDKCAPCLTFKAKQPKAPLATIVDMHPLELVHLNYLCLEPGKGLEENALVVTDHFTNMPKPMSHGPRPSRQLPKPSGTISSSTMGCLKRSSWIRVEILRVSWWLISVSWWGPKSYEPAHITPRLMASVRCLIPLWLVCWECYP